MNSDLQYLAKLIEMIDKESNDHSRKKLWSLIGMLAKKEIGQISEKETTLLLTEVHELNMEQYIRVQAEKFYENMALPKSNVKILIQDFIEMEHSRRRDDFENFSLAIYQQLENLINHLIDSHNYILQAQRDINIPVIVTKYGPQKGTRKGAPLFQSVFIPAYKKSNDKWIELSEDEKQVYYTSRVSDLMKNGKFALNFLEKSRLILFYCYFNTEVPNYDSWNEVSSMFKLVHVSRNSIHRSIQEVDQSESIIPLKRTNSYINYLSFLGFLADFIHKINVHLIEQK